MRVYKVHRSCVKREESRTDRGRVGGSELNSLRRIFPERQIRGLSVRDNTTSQYGDNHYEWNRILKNTKGMTFKIFPVLVQTNKL